MRQHELEHPGQKAGLARRNPDGGGLYPSYGKEARHELGIGRNEAERLDGDGFGFLLVDPVMHALALRAASHVYYPRGQPGKGLPQRFAFRQSNERKVSLIKRRCRASSSIGWDMPKKVMIVEDNELNMKLFRDLIEASGYETVRTRNGLEALDLARAHRPDLILMDIQLPEVSGLDVTRWLKEDDDLRDIPVIAVTAFAMKGDEERIRQGGCEAYISKPISVGKFMETIKSYLGDA
jgi:two-component system, cell cycle response regulator DivK